MHLHVSLGALNVGAVLGQHGYHPFEGKGKRSEGAPVNNSGHAQHRAPGIIGILGRQRSWPLLWPTVYHIQLNSIDYCASIE